MQLISSPSLRHCGFLAVIGLGLHSLSGCALPPEDIRQARYEELEKASPQMSLSGNGTYFAGQLVAEAFVTRGLTGPMARMKIKRPPREMDPRISPHAIGEDLPGMERGSGNGRMGKLGSTQPPVTLRIALQNSGTAPATIIIRDVVSKLGNFVPQPEKLTLEPGQSAELEPMISRLGVIAESIALTLTLRQGDRTETQVLTLLPISTQ
ncbi:MAG: hypothetical protein K9M98_14035 [Cephaloticoccus sp.]|nr:hypothetical protein [Cephaloticoccus sp.]MCF7761615.1 hypothetical protein [Cephaloticoccus sp.]